MKYVLITPAHNEEAYIEKTLISMQSQTILPLKWIVVNDGSTDATDEIVEKYVRQNKWIELIKMPIHKDRHFAAKVYAFNKGYEKVKNIKYDFIGNLDADISFENEYFEYLLSKFKIDEKLGVCGTPFIDKGKHYNYRFTNIEHVSGACQLFRKKCFDEIEGYTPINSGGIDWVAVTTARMKGWHTKTFTKKTCTHHRKMGTGIVSARKTFFKQGQKDYFLGNHPIWEFFRVLFQMKSRPYIVGGILLFAGFAWGFFSRIGRPIPQELVKFHRTEQIERLKNILFNAIKLK